MKVKNIIAVTLCTTMMFALIACKMDSKTTGQATDGSQTVADNLVGIANPWVDCETLKDAEVVAGFDIAAPESIEGYEEKIISAIKNEMIQVNFNHGDNAIYLRKGVKDGANNDISGDYNNYESSENVDINGCTVTFRGNDGTVNVAIWINGDFCYAIGSSVGLEAEYMSSLVRQLQ